MFQWLGYAFSCPKIIPLVNDDEAPWSYHCRILGFIATAERERIHEFAANVSCFLHEGDSGGTPMSNSSEVFSGTYVVPKRSSTHGSGGAWWEPDGNGEEWLWLERPKLLLNDSTCFREADSATLLEHGESPQFCPDFNPEQPLECCIGRMDDLVDSHVLHVACVSAAIFGAWLFLAYVLPHVFAGCGGRYAPIGAEAKRLA